MVLIILEAPLSLATFRCGYVHCIVVPLGTGIEVIDQRLHWPCNMLRARLDCLLKFSAQSIDMNRM